MNINDLIANIKDKLNRNIQIDDIKIEDKSFLHKKHKGFIEGKFHLKIFIKSSELNNLSKIESNKKIYKILDQEMKMYIHSLQILIS
tara:strand:+ start:10800 stop:11060 length:261 start_codon:yes stop_codon:yes gene_type:complete